MLRNEITLVALLLCFSGVCAQTGPGGVGNVTDNGLWLRADALGLVDGALVNQWADLSGNGNDANQSIAARQPIYVASSPLNGQPSVRLDGRTNANQGDRLIIDDNDILDGSASISYFVVLRPTSLDAQPRGILGKRTNQGVLDNTYSYTWYFHTDQTLWLDVNTRNDRFATTAAFANGQNYLLGWDFDGSRASASRSRVFNAGQVIQQSSESSAVLFNSPEPLVIGGLNEAYPQYLGADYTELIHYNRSLSNLERLLVNNYLSGKYAIPLATGDLYTQDDAGNGNYDHDIAGIGRISANDQLTQAQGSGLLQVENPSDLDDNEYLIWGHDGLADTLVTTSNAPPSTGSRLVRTWRLNEVNGSGSAVNVGAVDLAFDLSGLGLTDGDVQLLVDTDDDGEFTDEVPITGARTVGAEVFQFDAVTALVDGTRFTVGTTALALPIDLADLYLAHTADGQVALHWETRSETDNDYFAIERATPSTVWVEIGRMTGGGTTAAAQTYRYVDLAPLVGQLYYRLRQVDYDGGFTHSPVRSILGSAATSVSLFPNPASDWIAFRTHSDSDRRYRVFGIDGKEVTAMTNLLARGKSITVNVSNLPPGTYFVVTEDHRYRFSKR